VDGTPWWPPADEHAILAVTRRVLETPRVIKVCHNALYELFCWKWAHGVTLRGVADTMLKWHEANAEMEKALEVVASFLTRQPYWKAGRDARTEEERAVYNCTDSAVTLEVDEALGGLAPDGSPHLTAAQYAHYAHRLALLEPALDQMVRGVPYDVTARDALVARLEGGVLDLQATLDTAAGIASAGFRDVVGAVVMKKARDWCLDWPDIEALAKPLWGGSNEALAAWVAVNRPKPAKTRKPRAKKVAAAEAAITP
jgi:hypothetical protein